MHMLIDVIQKYREKKIAHEFYQQLSPGLIYSSTFSKWKSFLFFFLSLLLRLLMLRVLELSFQLNFILPMLQSVAIAPFVHIHVKILIWFVLCKRVGVCVYFSFFHSSSSFLLLL